MRKTITTCDHCGCNEEFRDKSWMRLEALGHGIDCPHLNRDHYFCGFDCLSKWAGVIHKEATRAMAGPHLDPRGSYRVGPDKKTPGVII